MSKEAVLALIHVNAEPVPGSDRWLDLQEQLAANREKASADTAHAARPILGNLVKLERGVVNDRLNRGDYVVIGISDAYPAANRPDTRLGKAGGQFANRVRMEDAIRIDGNNNLGIGVLQRVTNRACLSTIGNIPPGADANVGEIALGLERPLVGVVNRTVVLCDDFKLVAGIVALADAFNGFVDRLAFVEARHENAHGGLVGVVLLDSCARERQPENDSHQVLDRGNQQAKDHDQPEKYRGHYRHASREASLIAIRELRQLYTEFDFPATQGRVACFHSLQSRRVRRSFPGENQYCAGFSDTIKKGRYAARSCSACVLRGSLCATT